MPTAVSKSLFWLVGLPLSIVFCFNGHAVAREKVVMAVAANVLPAMQQLKPMMEQALNVDIEVIPGASGKLATQIREGAPYDVFASADMGFPRQLFTEGLTWGAPVPYATGVLVLWTVQQGLTNGLFVDRLTNPAIRKIAIANPRSAPYGLAATQAMQFEGVYGKIKNKIVEGESIGQTAQYVETGNADVGFVAKSQVLVPAMKGRGKWVEVNPKSYEPLVQGLVLIKHGAAHNLAADAVYHYLLSAQAKTVFRELGYLVN